MHETEFRGFYRNEGGATEHDVDIAKPLDTPARITPEEQIDAAHAALQAALRDELLQRILTNSPDFFEQLIVDLLVAMGYGGSYKDAAAQLDRSGDGGVDGIVNEDRLGLDRIYVQAKRYAPATPSVARTGTASSEVSSASAPPRASSSPPLPSASPRATTSSIWPNG
jgi:restriction system protein